MGTWRDLTVYKKAFANAMAIFELTKKFPPEEKYALTGQIIRSSRSVCSCFAEGYRKRRYKAHFVSKMTDSDSENTETLVWLDFAFGSKYISPVEYQERTEATEEVGKMLGDMIEHPDKYIGNLGRK